MKHTEWIIDTGQILNTPDDNVIHILEFNRQNDAEVLSAWAKHLRNHYCSDGDIDDLRAGYGLSRRDYLLQIIFPDSRHPPGPSVRAGDFGEILIADYIEFILNYVVPRIRYCHKLNRNQSPKGVDVIGFQQNEEKPSPNDKLITFEVKCALSVNNQLTLKNAVRDSMKDFSLRKSESLNAMYQRLRERGQNNLLLLVQRFQNKVDRPYKEISGAGAIHSTDTFTEEIASNVITTEHPNTENLFLLILKGEDLMQLVHSLYRRAADES